MLLSCTFFYIFQVVPAVKRRNENVIVIGFFFSFILSILYDWFLLPVWFMFRVFSFYLPVKLYIKKFHYYYYYYEWLAYSLNRSVHRDYTTAKPWRRRKGFRYSL